MTGRTRRLEDDQECSEQMSAISALLEAGEEAQAREQLSLLTERFQGDAMVHSFASTCYAHLGDIPNAMAENAAAMALRPADPAGFERLGALLRQKGYTQVAEQIQGKTLVTVDAKWVKRVNSPLMLLVAALTGVSVSFAPLFLYMAGWQAGQARQGQFPLFDVFNPWVLLCFAVIYFVPGFYMSLAGSVMAQLYRPRKRRDPRKDQRYNQWIVLTVFGGICVFSTLTTFHTIVWSASSIRLGHYYHWSSGMTVSTVRMALLSTLFVYAVTAWHLVKFRMLNRRMVWLLAPLCALFVILAGVGHVQIQRDARDSDLQFAAQRGDLKTVNRLLDQGANIEAKSASGMSPLMYAAEHGQMETVKTLLARGADLRGRDIIGLSAVAIAARAGQTETLKLLLDRGADPNSPDDSGVTPLMWAAAFASHQTVQVLVAHGALVNAQDKRGKTALMMAAGDKEELGSRGDAATIRVLLAAGADVRIQDHNGNTALTAARRHGRTDLVAALRPEAVER